MEEAMIDFDERSGSRRATEGGHIRCPLCGKVSPAERFDEEVVEQHVLERLERVSYGGRVGFRWTRGLDWTLEDFEAVQACILVARRRVRDAAEEAGAEIIDDEAEEEDEDEQRW
jgi:hypothetical protein